MTTILVVDDEPPIINLLTMLLDDEGYGVLPAGDGLAALEVLARTAVDVVITDVMMPRLDGVGLVRTMRARTAWRSIPAILLSAAEPPALDGLGPCTFVAKPFDLTALLEAVHRAVRCRPS